jgi:hypothetical protein
VSGATEKATKLEQQVNENKFNKEAKNKMDYVTTLKSSASSFLFRDLWDQANSKLEEAKGVLNELSQVRFYYFSLLIFFRGIKQILLGNQTLFFGAMQKKAFLSL